MDPFGAVIKDGYIWGRGSTDDKPHLTAMLMAMLLMKRSGAKLDRDLIFLAESGEEADPTGVGINFMVAQHYKEIEAEYAITEGGGATIEDGPRSKLSILALPRSYPPACAWLQQALRVTGLFPGRTMHWSISPAPSKR